MQNRKFNSDHTTFSRLNCVIKNINIYFLNNPNNIDHISFLSGLILIKMLKYPNSDFTIKFSPHSVRLPLPGPDRFSRLAPLNDVVFAKVYHSEALKKEMI